MALRPSYRYVSIGGEPSPGVAALAGIVPNSKSVAPRATRKKRVTIVKVQAFRKVFDLSI